jgi:predicted nucleic acid-binding protein
MSVLVDTNVLLRLVHATSPGHIQAAAALETLSTSVELCLVPQVIYEFWVASTRPLNVNGFGIDAVSAERAIERLLRRFRLRRDERGVFGHWQTLVVAHDVKGKNAHDARLVAAMQRHGLTRLLTFNKPDFERFQGILVFTPAEVLAGLLPA